MTSTLTEKAVIGRRVQFAYYSNLQSDSETVWHPGIITAIEPGLTNVMLASIRLDGERRSGLHIPTDYEGMRYLDQVVPVPELPMGRFTPTADDFGGDWEGVPILQCESEDIVILTDDQARAAVALHAFCQDMLIDREYLPAMQSRWAVFEWEPEDAEIPWTVNWDAAEGDDQALHIYYLPA
jgi:hypothetical protein